MSKVFIMSNLKQKDTNTDHKVETTGIFNDNNELIYYDGDIIVTLIKKLNKIDMKRKSNDYEIELSFSGNSTTKGYYRLLNLNSCLELNILTKRLNIDDNKILIEYQLIMEETNIQNYLFSIEYRF